MQKIVSTLASVADCSLTSPTSSHTRKGAMARSKATGGFVSASLPNARTCEPSYGSGEGEMAGDNLYVGKAAKSGRPTTRGTILTPKGEKMLAERERVRESTLHPQITTIERGDSGGLVHVRCQGVLAYKGSKNALGGIEHLWWCTRCFEVIYVPEITTSRIPRQRDKVLERML